jgi:hypothetical protein
VDRRLADRLFIGVVTAKARWQDLRMGPITIFDKSALQALNMDEAVWFDAFFLANVVPLFYVETLADLEKAVAEGKTPEDIVGMLAAKTPSGAVPNVYHRALISAELLGQEIEMSGRAMVGAGEAMKAPDGKLGIHIDEFPEAATLLRWKNHEFLEIERAAAKGWRAELAAQDPDRLIGVLKNILLTEAKVTGFEELKAVIDSFCASDEREVITLALDVLGVPAPSKRVVLERWEAAGRPGLEAFAPYSTHVFKVDLLYYLGIHRGFISGERASNKADMAYLYYLPFAMVFVSGDKLHHRTVPLFLRPDQSYVHADEFKAALREIDQHYDRLPEGIKELGVLQFASFPPLQVENTVTRLWDKHMRPEWREIAKQQEAEIGKPRDEAYDRETVAEIRSRLDQAQPIVGEEAHLGGDEAAYIVIRRQVPVRKGKWRMVSKEVEEAEREN